MRRIRTGGRERRTDDGRRYSRETGFLKPKTRFLCLFRQGIHPLLHCIRDHLAQRALGINLDVAVRALGKGINAHHARFARLDPHDVVSLGVVHAHAKANAVRKGRFGTVATAILLVSLCFCIGDSWRSKLIVPHLELDILALYSGRV